MMECLSQLEDLNPTCYPLSECLHIALQKYYCPHPIASQSFKPLPLETEEIESKHMPPHILVPDTPNLSSVSTYSLPSVPFASPSPTPPVILAPNTSSPAIIILIQRQTVKKFLNNTSWYEGPKGRDCTQDNESWQNAE
ncbi:hypothetical protein ARMGADRAFT_1031961 [Armillaria gallica]|uniref:Uncharacterized protein n=1 Tax=Armillaria gallica TaxID=47427 RepID=A0A2H3DB11_ARMGA|nr:hypothetical protein ARMGADRAFT_1031961 [Armillaria gallica]